MPNLFLNISDTQLSVSRPIVHGIIKDLFDLTNIPESTFISFPGDLDTMQQPGSDISKITQQPGITTNPYSDRVFIEVEEDYEMDRILSTANYRVENTFIFRDDNVEVSLRPIYSSSEVTINFKYRASDRPKAESWRNYIKTRVSMNWDQRIHKVDYHYLVPLEFLIIIKEIHRLMENVDGYGVELNEYLKTGFTNRATVMTTQAGTRAAWAIVESQIRIIGHFDFDLVPEKSSKEDDADAWTIGFAYKFKYEKPLACTMRYPLMIHNQLLPQNYRNNPLTDKLDPLEGKEFGFSLSSELFYHFEKNNETARLWALNGWSGVSIPSYDEFVPNGTIPGTDRVFTALISVDLNDPHKLLSLRELGEYSLNPAVLDFLIDEGPYLTKPGLSIFSLSMYRGSLLLDADALIVDSDLNVYSTYVLSLRKYYHIRLSVQRDLTTINQAAIDRLRKHGDAALVVLDFIDPTLKTNNNLPPILGNNYITRESMTNVINILNNITGRAPLMRTVETLMILANPMKDLRCL